MADPRAHRRKKYRGEPLKPRVMVSKDTQGEDVAEVMNQMRDKILDALAQRFLCLYCEIDLLRAALARIADRKDLLDNMTSVDFARSALSSGAKP